MSGVLTVKKFVNLNGVVAHFLPVDVRCQASVALLACAGALAIGQYIRRICRPTCTMLRNIVFQSQQTLARRNFIHT
jgi:hypothetical protein